MPHAQAPDGIKLYYEEVPGPAIRCSSSTNSPAII